MLALALATMLTASDFRMGGPPVEALLRCRQCHVPARAGRQVGRSGRAELDPVRQVNLDPDLLQGPFGGVRALVNLRAILAELGTPSIPSAFPVSQIHSAFDDDGTPLDHAYDERVVKFLDEFEWYASALKQARGHENLGENPPTQQALCRGNQKSA